MKNTRLYKQSGSATPVVLVAVAAIIVCAVFWTKARSSDQKAITSQTQLTQTKTDLAQLVTQLDQSKTTAVSLQKQLDDTKASAAQFQTQAEETNAQLRQEVAALTTGSAELKAQLADITAQVAPLQMQADKDKAYAEKTQAMYDELRVSSGVLKKQATDANIMLAETEAKLAAANGKVAELQKAAANPTKKK